MELKDFANLGAAAVMGLCFAWLIIFFLPKQVSCFWAARQEQQKNVLEMGKSIEKSVEVLGEVLNDNHLKMLISLSAMAEQLTVLTVYVGKMQGRNAEELAEMIRRVRHPASQDKDIMSRLKNQ